MKKTFMCTRYCYIASFFGFYLLNLATVNAAICITKDCKLENKTPFNMYVYKLQKNKNGVKKVIDKQYLPKKGVIHISPNLRIDKYAPEFLFAKTKSFPKKKSDRYLILSYKVNDDNLAIAAIPTILDKRIAIDASSDPLIISVQQKHQDK